MPKKRSAKPASKSSGEKTGLDTSGSIGITEAGGEQEDVSAGGVDFSKPLENQKWEAFARLIAKAKSGSEAYSQVYGTTGNTSEVNASRLLSNAQVKGRIEYIQTKAAEGDVLSIKEKREYLARVVRTCIGQIDETSDLCQSAEYIVMGGMKGQLRRGLAPSGNEQVQPETTTVKLRVVDKLKAIEIDNELAGHIPDKPGLSVSVGVSVNVLTEERRKQLSEKKRTAALRRAGANAIAGGAN